MAKNKQEARERRKKSIRKRVVGTAERPRLSVFRSARHMYAQVIDDTANRTLVSASTLEESVRSQKSGLDKKAQAKQVGVIVAEKCLAQNIGQVVFDRNGFKYHGRVQTLAAGARDKGLKF